jgi:hypothetical protein
MNLKIVLSIIKKIGVRICEPDLFISMTNERLLKAPATKDPIIVHVYKFKDIYLLE